MNRRDFLNTGVALSALPSLAVAATPRRVGLIGCGWYGKIDLVRLIQVEDVEVVSLCDVDSTMLSNCADMIAGRQKSKKRPAVYKDYREMLRQKNLDIVLIATPDHWHALIMIEAAKAGVDMYCQKPISVDVIEAEAMLAAARKYKRVVQIGTQRRSTPHLVEAREKYVKTGLLGQVKYAEVYCYYHMRATANPADTTPPANLDYEMWTGPAPMRPYNSLVHPRSWRAFMEYGNGIMGDMCVHMLDLTRFMLDLKWPKSVSSQGGIYVDKASKANIADTQTATFQFDDLDVVWGMRSWGDAADPKHPWGATLYGDKGTLKLDVYGYDFTPIGKDAKTVHVDVKYEYEQYPEDKTEKDLERHVAPAIRAHMKDLLQAIDKRSRPVADIEEGYISTVSCILGNIAMKTGRTLRYDPKTRTVVGDKEATALLRRPYRTGYVHPEPEKV